MAQFMCIYPVITSKRPRSSHSNGASFTQAHLWYVVIAFNHSFFELSVFTALRFSISHHRPLPHSVYVCESYSIWPSSRVAVCYCAIHISPLPSTITCVLAPSASASQYPNVSTFQPQRQKSCISETPRIHMLFSHWEFSIPACINVSC